MTEFEGIHLTAHRAVVVGDQVWSETRVSGGGGGVAIHGIGIASSRTKSTVTNKRETWFKLEDGTELPLHLNADVFKLRPGQEFAMVLARPSNGKLQAVCIKNLATGQQAFISPLYSLKPLTALALFGAIPMNIICVLLLLAEVTAAAAPLLGNVLVYSYVVRARAFKGEVGRLIVEAERKTTAQEELPAAA